jgi:hypothetical protein
MERELKQVIRQKITDALAASVPAHTRRDVHLPSIKGKAMAVIGMRRSGKTTFLWQCLGKRLEDGTPRDALLYFNFDVSGQSKPATKGRMKTSHFEGSIAYRAAWAAHGRNERTQCELAAYDFNFGGQWLVQPADCA